MSRTPFLHRFTIIALVTVGAVGTALAHDYEAGELHIGHPWARTTAPQQQNGAAYFVVTNQGDTADRLVDAESPVASRVELHTHQADDAGVMRMRQVEAIELPAGEPTALAPGGLHVMLIGLESPLVEGETFPLTLVFEAAGAVEVEVQVESVTFGVDESTGHDQGHSH